MDAIYARIVSRPVVDLRVAIEKLCFAYQCLTEEDDIKEAANLVLQVCVGLQAFAAEGVVDQPAPLTCAFSDLW
jgi:hypothetical protein